VVTVQAQRPELSIVIPVFEEEENVEPLVRGVCEAVRPLARPFEVVVVDDGSRDATLERLKTLLRAHPELVVVALRRNFGQTPALQAGFDRARGDIIVTMDGDLQNDPADIPLLIERIDAGADVVSGWRVDRQDTLVLRKLPSWIANRMIRWITGVPVHDQGCSLKAYRQQVVRRLGLYSDMHRFIAVMTMPLGARIEEIPVRHHARVAGASKYGISRVFKVLADLLTIQMITRFRESPMRWFAWVGAPFLGASLVCALAAIFLPDGSIVMPTVSLLLGFVFVSCLFAGVMGEAIIDLSARDVPRRDVGVREWGTQA
jgi:glycosyltransferase involved in cell wall biosynthesis